MQILSMNESLGPSHQFKEKSHAGREAHRMERGNIAVIF